LAITSSRRVKVLVAAVRSLAFTSQHQGRVWQSLFIRLGF
jgi:hypothetical protein